MTELSSGTLKVLTALFQANILEDSPMLYAGMDVHVRNSYFAISDAAGQVLRSGRCLNTPAAMAEFLEEFEGQEMTACLESTTNSRAIHHMVLQAARQQG